MDARLTVIALQGRGKASDTDEGISSDSECPSRVQSLMRQLQEKESEITRLEWQAAHWQQKYHDQCALSLLAVDAASKPKSVAALSRVHNASSLMTADGFGHYRHMSSHVCVCV